ncbi:Mitochondrial escape protein 2 [Paramyrothecium foliicola]|nr:Mitochondrial escape protein 2 [Paramyrothecium foliicola]
MIVTPRPATVLARPGLKSHLALRPSMALLSLARPRGMGLVRKPLARAWESTMATPENKEHGHISVQPNESVLFFTNLFPLTLSSILTRPLRTDRDLTELIRRFDSSSFGITDPIRLVKMAIPQDLAIKVTEILPTLKDGGAFVKFEHDPQLSASEIEETLTKKLEESPLKPWFNPFQRIKARLVRGTPWLEDLYRYPSSLVKVEFVPPQPGTTPVELSEETLYTLFRRYGKIADIIPQPADSKVTPRYAMVGFPVTRDAIMTRNCMHGFVVDEVLGGGKDGTKLRMSYERKVKKHSIWNWLTSHPRIVVPAIAALIAGISVIVFDPMREFFVKLHIQHSLHFTDSRIYKWFKSQADGFSFGRKKDKNEGLNSVWKHRRDLIDQLRGWLDGSSDTFIVVTGPKGSGKAEMVMDQTLEGRKNVLMIDCRPIVEARGESGTIKRLATAVGYRPVFSWANSMSSMIDLAVQSTTGVKAGFSETLESQLNKILQITASSLKDVALSDRSSKDNDAKLSEDAFLEAHPERRPVVVIDNFLHKSEEKSIVYDKIADWAASIVQNNVAHVIFLTRDSSFAKPLTKALPDRVFRTLSLGDLDPEVARNFVLGRLEEYKKSDEKESKEAKEAKEADEKAQATKPDLAELDECISTLGGRLTDLEFFSRRLRTGQAPRQALTEIVDENATDIVKMFLLGKTSDTERKWSTQQAWHLVKALAKNPSLRYNQILLSPAFASSTTPAAADGEAALESLTSAELISVKFHKGRPQTITAGKPLHQAAFSVLQHDSVLRAKMDLAVLSETAKGEAKSIDSVENELALLGSLPKQTSETAGRISYLLKKLEGSHNKIAQLDTEMATLKKILNEEY